MIRVLLVIGQLGIGGAESQVTRLARRLGGFGIHPEVAIYHPGNEEELLEAGIRVHHVKRTSKIGLEAILDLVRILRQGRFDVVHSYLWPANWRARIAALLARTPVIISSTRSVETWLKPHHVLVDRLLSLWTDAIIVNAAAIREFVTKREGLRDSLFHVIYNGLDERNFTGLPTRPEARSRLGLSEDAPVVLIVGNLQPEKNHGDFLRMAARVSQRLPTATFFVVGDGETRDSLDALARELNLRDSIRWEGQKRDVLPYLAASDVFVNVSWREGCCNAILEAMAAARPVVAYAVGGNPELIRHGETGRILDAGDLAGLAEGVIYYLEHPDVARKDGMQGAKRAAENFRALTMVEQTVALYHRCLRKNRVHPGGAAESQIKN